MPKKDGILNLSLSIHFALVISFVLTMSSGCIEVPEKKFLESPEERFLSRLPENYSFSGFLSPYPKFFRPGPKGGMDLVYIKEGVDFKSYTKVMMDYVVFYFKEDADYQGIDPWEMKKLANTFHKAMVKILGDEYPLVGKPGPDVLRFRVAIANLTPIKLDFTRRERVLSSGWSRRGSESIGKHYYVGEASIEAELLDSQTNKRLAVAIDKKVIEKHKFGVGKWEHVEDAFGFWARRLRLFLDNAHGKKRGMEKTLSSNR